MPLDKAITGKWRVPAYAQDMLRLISDECIQRIEWGAGGPTLVFWKPPALEPTWSGRVKVGGFIERLHAFEIAEMEIVIAEIVGGAFPAAHSGLPTLEDMKRGIYARPADLEPYGTDQTYPFILMAESNFAALAQDALVSGLAVDAVGTLADDQTAWRDMCGLPLLIESLTLLAPG